MTNAAWFSGLDPGKAEVISGKTGEILRESGVQRLSKGRAATVWTVCNFPASLNLFQNKKCYIQDPSGD